MDSIDRKALEYHSAFPAGKIAVKPTKPTDTQEDLSLAYTPGVAAPVMAIADNIEDRMAEKCHRKALRSQGRENALWIIVDYGDIVVHVFQTQYREFYRLEDLWADAERTEYSGEN